MTVDKLVRYTLEAMTTRLLLKDIIEMKRKDNPRLSLRWIAAKMGVSSGRLSEILNNKRPLTELYVEKFCTALKLTAEDANQLRRSFQQAQNPNRASFGPILPEDVVERLADWKPFALMSFFQTTIYEDLKGKANTPDAQIEEIATLINLPKDEIQTLLTSMTTAQLIEWKNGQWHPVYTEATTGYDIPSSARQAGHIRDLSLAQNKVETVKVSERDFSSMTLTMDPRDIPKAKKMIRTFRRNFARSMEKGAKKSVYRISIQFFPVVSLDER